MTHSSATNPPKLTVAATVIEKIAHSAMRTPFVLGQLALGLGRLLASVPQAIGKAVTMAYVDPFTPSARQDDRSRHLRR